jgi:hypothetical protein
MPTLVMIHTVGWCGQFAQIEHRPFGVFVLLDRRVRFERLGEIPRTKSGKPPRLPMMLRIHRSITAGALTLFSLFPAFASDTSQLLGHWHGLGQSETDRRFIIPCVDVLTPGVDNRFQADIEISLHDGEIIPCVFPADLVLSEGGVITGSGIHEEGGVLHHRLVIHGRVQELGNGLRLAAFNYKIFEWHGGLLDEGHIALFQLIGGVDTATDVGVFKEGEFVPVDAGQRGGPLVADLTNEKVENSTTRVLSPLIGGTIEFVAPPDPVLPSLVFDVAGTVGPESTTSPAAFAVIGVTNLGTPPEPVQPTGIIAILTGFVDPVEPGTANPPEPVRGTYKLYDSFYDVFTDVFHGADSNFGQGTFELGLPQTP